MRTELREALAREAELRASLSEQVHAYERGLGSEKDLMRRAEALDERNAKLAAFETELTEREKRLTEQR